MDTAMRDLEQIEERDPGEGQGRSAAVFLMATLVTGGLVYGVAQLLGGGEAEASAHDPLAALAEASELATAAREAEAEEAAPIEIERTALAFPEALGADDERPEVDAVLGGGRARAEHARDLVYTKQVLEEAMRLYPPAWMIARSPEEDDVVGGYHIPRHSLVFLCPWVTHRHPDHWEDPEGFDPDRFSPERSADRHRFAYFPFGGGPRLCIGNNFALMEAQLILATLMRDWRLDLVSGQRVAMEPLVTLRPKHGLRMTAHRRRSA